MVAAASPPGGGAGPIDASLRDAYTSLAWPRQALRVMAADPAYDAVTAYGRDPVMSVLRKMDWDKTSVEDPIASLGKARSRIDEAVGDLEALLKKADNAWYGNDLVQEVGQTMGRISAPQAGPKGHTAPLRSKSG